MFARNLTSMFRNRPHWASFAAALVTASLATVAGAAAPTGPKVAVFPSDILLETSRDSQSIVVQSTGDDGVTQDVTEKAKFTLENPALVKKEGNTFLPVADGKTNLKIEFGGKTLNVPVTVVKAKEDRPISLRLDVMPVFMRSDCNSGACHGASRGKDGFRLSLFGFDPAGDHYRLTREFVGRRINLAEPRESLLLKKGTGDVFHTGGNLFEEDDYLYNTVLRWLEAGAPDDPATIATPVSLELYPSQMVLIGPGSEHRMTVRAKYSDGTDRDVTNLAKFLSNNDSVASIDADGIVKAGQRGEAFVMARFATFTVGSQVIVIPEGAKSTPIDSGEANYIDQFVNAKLNKLRIKPSDVCSDEVFLRRVSIDIVGKLPTVEQYEKFVNDPDPYKREKLVDELLASKEFVEMWVMKWAELLQIRQVNNQVSRKAVFLYFNWLKEQIANDVPMDQIVQKLLASKGGTFANPPANYYMVERDKLKVAENVAQVFMGMRIQCAQCHNHPFDRWTMDDYYGFVSFFSQVGRKQGEDPAESIIFDAHGGEVKHPVSGKPLPPKFLGGAVPELQNRDRREVLAEWLASPENPYFARNLSNLVWDHFFGMGIIDPVDDVRISNPASNPELLDALSQHLVDYKYDFKKLVRDICLSQTYQRSTRSNKSNELDNQNFSHALVRRIRAEVFIDCLTQVTGGNMKYSGLPLGSRAVEIADGRVSNYFLTTFGRATRETVCSCEVKMEPNLSQALHLLNGDSTNRFIDQGKVVPKMLNEKKSPEEIINTLYIMCLTRKPTDEEKKFLLDKVSKVEKQKEKEEILEDLFWSLLNSKEFMFNH